MVKVLDFNLKVSLRPVDNRGIKLAQTEMRMTWTIFVVCMTYVLFATIWTLSTLVNSINTLQVLIALTPLYHGANFVIYALMSNQFRKAYRLLIETCWEKVKEVLLGSLNTRKVHSSNLPTTALVHKDFMQMGPSPLFSIHDLIRKQECLGGKISTYTQNIGDTTLMVLVLTKIQKGLKTEARGVRHCSESEISNFVHLNKSKQVKKPLPFSEMSTAARNCGDGAFTSERKRHVSI